MQENLFAGELFDGFERVVNRRQIAQAKEVYLEQPNRLEVFHVILGAYRAVADAQERGKVRHIPWGDDDPGGVGRGIAGQPFELARDGQELVHLGVRLVAAAQLAYALERFVERRAEGDELGDLIRVGVRKPQHAGHVAHHAARLHLVKRRDLSHPLPTVFALYILNDLIAAAHTEVNIDIGEADARGVQKAFKDQSVLERVYIGDAQTVTDQAAGGRAAPRPHRDIATLREFHKVLDDQKIPGIAHLGDHIEFVLQTVCDLLGECAEARLRPFIRQRTQIIVRVTIPRGQRKRRQMRFGKIEFQITLLRDAHCMLEGLRPPFKERRQLVKALKIILFALIGASVFIGEGLFAPNIQ
ncbi:hypothetical protein HRbin07_00504 [bacterium HR07]|nr:hypothetical protein HRbin07_00504 [bacterium HR07]